MFVFMFTYLIRFSRHMSLASDVRDTVVSDPSSLLTGELYGVEMLASSVTRANVDEILVGFVPSFLLAIGLKLVANVVYLANPHFKYFEGTEHGYGVLNFYADNITGEFWHTKVTEASPTQWLARKLVCPKNKNQWVAIS